jgi:hypothetical protein
LAAVMSILWLPLVALPPACVGAAGLAAGIQFLRLQEWARTALAILTALALVLVVGSGLLCVFLWCSVTDEGALPGEEVFGLSLGILVATLLAAPLAMMLGHLVSERVKGAMGVPVEPSD